MSAIASAPAQPAAREPAAPAASLLPDPAAWAAAAARHEALFAPLDAGARVALLARSAPSQVLVWVIGEIAESGGSGGSAESGSGGDDRVSARLEAFAGYAASGADIVLAADDESLAAIRAALGGAHEGAALFETLRAAIRAGHVVCYMLKRRCVLEERGFDEMLDALGFVFMGACR
ncbi:MAG: hypothetical protein JNL85_11735 [Rubrivivax sp.]|nr:hypothetical protein [Rubrivivax sp.]